MNKAELDFKPVFNSDEKRQVHLLYGMSSV
jgi:hypothetical protein